VIALLPLFFIMPTMTGSPPRLPTDPYIGGLRGADGPHQPGSGNDANPGTDHGPSPTGE
jgi:hypothetical protein